MTNLLCAAAVAFGMIPATAGAALGYTTETRTYHRVEVDGTAMFYREAGPKNAPAIVLLHGFPSSSAMWEPLLPFLATRYHLIAPDYPGFGLSAAPTPAQYSYTFDHLADSVDALLTKLRVTRYVLFMQDYGGPVGFRLALKHPDRIRGIIVQNANAYREGLGAKWTGIARYWADPGAHPEIVDAFLSLEGAKQRHLGISPNVDRYDPDTWLAEYAALSRPGARNIHAALLYDYRTNVETYPVWQNWMRVHQPPALILWGKYDPSFIVPGAVAFRRDLPEAEVHVLDAGHFALDEKTEEIARLSLDFLDRLTREEAGASRR